MSATAMKRVETLALPLFAGAVLIATWSAAVAWTGTKVFPSPPSVLRGLVELSHRGVLLPSLRDSLLRVASGYLLAAGAGTLIGLLMGWYAWLAISLNPVIQMLRPVSPLAWIPVAIVLFGVGSSAAVFLIFLGAFFPIVVTTMNGVRQVPRMYLLVGRNFGLSPAAILWRVVLPAALPQILTGFRIALGIAWLVVVAAEMVAVDSGLGYLIIDSRNAGKRYDLVVAGMLLIGLVGLTLDLGMRSIGKLRFARWGMRTD